MSIKIHRLLIAALFLLLGLVFIAESGIHVDAANEMACLYPCGWAVWTERLMGRDMPLMTMTYLGSIKAWLYLPLLRVFEAGPVLLRLPMLLIGAGTIWLFFLLLERWRGPRAAIAGSLLLATDASFLLATTYDFGPIALLHFCLLAAMVLIQRFTENRAAKYLAAAFLLLGLAFWQKALFIWMLAGLAVAVIAVFHRRIRELASVRNVSIAVVSFCIGALPVLIYNIQTRGGTFRTADVVSSEFTISQKVHALRGSLTGTQMFGLVTEEDRPRSMVPPSGPLASFSVGLSRALGNLPANGILFALGASLLALPWLWFTPSRNAALFATVYMVVTWAQMAVTPKTGASIHHAILLWPFPHLLIAVAVAELWSRFGHWGGRLASAALTLILCANVLLVNQYYAHLRTMGTSIVFTDAVYPLTDYLRTLRGHKIVTVDWGYEATLCLLSKGTIPLWDLSFDIAGRSDTEATVIQEMVTDPTALFVEHVDGEEQFLSVNQRLDNLARDVGCHRQVVKTIADRNSRTRFQIIRYEPGAKVFTANRAQADRLKGFHEIEQGTWRWARKTFSVTFPGSERVKKRLKMDLYLPPNILARLGPITLSAAIDGVRLTPELYSEPGPYTYSREISLRGAGPIAIDFGVDKCLAAGTIDPREICVVVKTIELE